MSSTKKKNIKKDEYKQKWNEYLGLVNFGGVFLGLRNEQVELYLNFNQLKRDEKRETTIPATILIRKR